MTGVRFVSPQWERRKAGIMMILAWALLLGGGTPPGFSQDTRGQEPLRFAFITDVHVSVGSPSVEDLRRCIRDLNEDMKVDFVVFGGDITDFGSDEELSLAKGLIDSLEHEHYVLAGNHDANWSESGCNTFLRTFGYETFNFEKGGWRFIGCNSGPDMRMAPALVPHESMVWLENLEKDRKTVFFNHYPMDSSVLNYFQVTRALKKADVRFGIGGHWHRNAALNYGGIPAVLGRSGLSHGSHSGYSIINLWQDSVTVSERRVYSCSGVTLPPWYKAHLSPVKDTVSYDRDGLPADYPWMGYDVNGKYPQVKELWSIQDEYNIVAGSAISKNEAYYTTSSGYVRAVSLRDGHPLWSVKLPGKVFSTPALGGHTLVVGCSDSYIYALDTRKKGRVIWKTKADRSVVASPLIRDGRVYIGASDGVFRCLDLSSGRVIWKFEGVEGHVVSTPYLDSGQLVFGSWGRKLYSLDPRTGAPQWVWTVNRGSRMFSPASTVPLKADGKIFVAVPDRKVYAIDAATGEQVYVVDGGRDAIGQSEDGGVIYSKTMFSKAYALDPSTGNKLWEKNDRTGYEIAPTALSQKGGMLLIPTDKGNLIALDATTGEFLWAHKISLALVNPLSITPKGGTLHILSSTMDGKVTLLEVPIHN